MASPISNGSKLSTIPSLFASPGQTIAQPGFGLILTEHELMQPLGSVPLTTYVVFPDGITFIVDVVGPLDQVYVFTPKAVYVTLEPKQSVAADPATLIGAGVT